MTHPLDGFTSPEPLLVVGDDESAADLAPAGATFTTIAGATDIGRGWKSVLWMTADRASLRQRASALPRLGKVRVVAVWLTEATVPLVVHPRPEWPPITSVMAREAGQGVLIVLRFAAPVAAHQVLIECARQASDGDRGHGGLVVGYAGREAAAGLDVRAPFFDRAEDAGDPERDVPPDVVVGRDGQPEVHTVIDRAPLVVTDPGLEPIDEQVLNPRGWRKDWDESVRDFVPGQRLTEQAIEELRGVQGLRVDLATADPRTVAGLAMAGIPLLATGSNAALSEELTHALAKQNDLDDPLAREQHSVTTRRAALDTHSTLAWRRDLAARAGVRFVAQPKVTVLLATMRPHQLDFAMRQLARQQDVELQVVLGTHGWTVTEGEVRAKVGHDVVVRHHDQDAFFGDVLNDAASVADGDVLLKVDDDDWYSPHAIHDLLLARRYTGAEVVGMPSEFVYLEELGVTARRNHPTEIHNRFVAGGTIMIDRQVLRSVGGFRRVRRFVDAQLLNAVEASGGRIYRTHGLGYMLRRTASGHTWQSDPESFRRPEILEREWPGFHAPPELVIEEGDLP
ncbi:MAG: glycosyltransferase [Nocardioides sp.]|uniref:glycosyltransferase n=1 Tax=Nocardioides sp. TaxID=35761 RepID=UPI003266BC7A